MTGMRTNATWPRMKWELTECQLGQCCQTIRESELKMCMLPYIVRLLHSSSFNQLWSTWLGQFSISLEAKSSCSVARNVRHGRGGYCGQSSSCWPHSRSFRSDY